LAATAAVYVLGWGLARLVGRLLRRDTPYWRALLPWLAFQSYLAVGLLAGPEPPTRGFLLAAAVGGGLTLAAAYIRRAGHAARGRALLTAWALPWTVAVLLSLFRRPAA
jgi:hypothetical protein